MATEVGTQLPARHPRPMDNEPWDCIVVGARRGRPERGARARAGPAAHAGRGRRTPEQRRRPRHRRPARPRRPAAGGPLRRRSRRAGRLPDRGGAGRRGRRRRGRARPASCSTWPTAPGSCPGGCCSPPGWTTATRTCPAWPSGGAARCSTARSATAGRCGAGRSACSTAAPPPASTGRCCSGPGATTSRCSTDGPPASTPTTADGLRAAGVTDRRAPGRAPARPGRRPRRRRLRRRDRAVAGRACWWRSPSTSARTSPPGSARWPCPPARSRPTRSTSTPCSATSVAGLFGRGRPQRHDALGGERHRRRVDGRGRRRRQPHDLTAPRRVTTSRTGTMPAPS